MNSRAVLNPLAYYIPILLSVVGFMYARRSGIIGRPLPIMVTFVVAALLQFASAWGSPSTS